MNNGAPSPFRPEQPKDALTELDVLAHLMRQTNTADGTTLSPGAEGEEISGYSSVTNE